VLAFAGLVPLIIANTTSAAQLTNRSATIDKSAVSSTDVEFRFDYDLINTTNTKAGIIYSFCDNPLGACTLPTGMNIQTSNDQVSDNGWPTDGTDFAADPEQTVGDCDSTTNAYQICYSRDEATATGVTGGPVDHTISGITAPSSAQTVYVRISIYSDNDYGSGDLLDQGTVAVAFVDQLTINGRVQERLNFCVAALDDAAAVPADVATCTAITDTNVDLGIIDETDVAISPVETTATNGSDDDYGILMLNTNATAGAVISYYPQADAGGTNQLYAFRVDNATCNALDTTLTDQCFQSAASSGAGSDLTTAGTEGFGLTVACVDTSLGTTAALDTISNWYDGDDNDISNLANCDTADATNNEFGWNSSTSVAQTLVSSSGVVDDEVVKVLFGAQASATTPSGEYTVVTNYIATVTF
jgi:hypothetical protein